jgi:hypothetical protein
MTMRRPCAILTVICASGLLAACGGSADTAPPGSEANPLPALPNPAGTRTPPTEQPIGEPSVRTRSRGSAAAAPAGRAGRAGRAVPAGRPGHAGGAPARRAAAPATAAARASLTPKRAASRRARRRGERKQKALAPSTARPCSLVTKSQAQTILGTPIVEPLQAPQGPTCIYRSRSGGRFVTLAVQTASFARLEKQLRSARSVRVAGSTGSCGRYGRPMLYVPLARGRVLSVAAPCDVAARFAARAVARL